MGTEKAKCMLAADSVIHIGKVVCFVTTGSQRGTRDPFSPKTLESGARTFAEVDLHVAEELSLHGKNILYTESCYTSIPHVI